MLRKKQPKSQINGVKVEEGKSLMEQLRRMLVEGDIPEEEVPIIYTDKGEGVLPGYDIRTDRFEVAREAMEKAKNSEKKERAEKRASEKPIEQPKEKPKQE